MTENVNFQIFDMILDSDIITMLIYLVLIVYSVWSWSIVFDKVFKFRLLKIKTERFEKLFWSGKMLEDIYKQVKNSSNFPSAAIFSSIMQEWEASNVLEIVEEGDIEKKNSLKERLYTIAEISAAKSVSKLRYGMNFLLIVSTTATFFGLFGTVWGLLKSFLSVTAMQDTSLIVIAPGIADALITTILGLVAAIPATIFYNFYTAKINAFEDQMVFFSQDILNILSRELDQ